MSDVRVDEAALAAEAEAVAREYAPELSVPPLGPEGTPPPDNVPAAGSASREEILAGYVMVCEVVVGQGCDALAPAWGVTAAERSKLATAISKALMLWFPDQIIPPKYMALLAVAGVGFEIVTARRDPSTGRLKPLRHAESRKDDAA